MTLEERIEEKATALEATARRLREGFAKKLQSMVAEVGVECWVEFYGGHAVLFVPEGAQLPAHESRDLCQGGELAGVWHTGVVVRY